MDKIKNTIRTYLEKNFIYDDSKNFSDTESLTKSGFVDSIGLIEFIDFLSNKFKIKIPDNELNPKNLDSIEAAAKLVKRLKK